MSLEKIMPLIGLGFGLLGLISTIIRAKKSPKRAELLLLILFGLMSLVFILMFLEVD